MKNWLWVIWQGFTPCARELPNAAMCKWRIFNDERRAVCDASCLYCGDVFDTPRCRRLYERKP